METIIRLGNQSDLPRVLELVRELAAFEKAPDEVEVTIDEMANWGFGKDKIFDFFVLEKQARIIGLALYYYKYSTWKGKCLFLEDIIVTEAMRGRKIGKLLFDQLIEEAKEKKFNRIIWQVLEWNEPAINFYKKYNADFDPEWVNCSIYV